MDHNESYSRPELMKYLRGEISFDTWLEKQQGRGDYQAHQLTAPSNQRSTDQSLENESIFLSWGSAFTQQGDIDGEKSISRATSSNMMEGAVVTTEEEESDDYEEGDDSDDEVSIMKLAVPKEKNTSGEKISFDIKLPNFEVLPEPNVAEQPTVTWKDLKPIIEELAIVIPTSTVLKRYSKRKRKLTEERNAETPDIMKDFQNFQLRKRGNRKGAKLNRNKLPELLRLQMGQANLLVAKRDFKQAANICMEIIKEAPYSGLPFKTLSFIYEEQDDKEMSLQYSLIYAFLDCNDSQEWMDLAKKCLNAGNPKQALACYDKACKYKPWDIYLHWERGLKYFEYEDFRKCMDIYFAIQKRIDPGDKSAFMSCAKRLTKLYHKIGLTDRALESLQCSFDVCHNSKDYEAVNLLSELYMANKDYDKTLQLIHTQCDVHLPKVVLDKLFNLHDENLQRFNEFVSRSLTGDIQEETSSTAQKLTSQLTSLNINSGESLNILHGTAIASPQKKYTILNPMCETSTSSIFKEYKIPNDLPLDLRVKLAQCLIYCDEINNIENIVLPLFTEDINDVGDLVLDIGEAFFETGRYEEALKYISDVAESEKFNQAAVWLKLAEIYQHLCETDQSIDAYYQVLTLAPRQVSVRLALTSALKEMGRNEEANTVLSEYDYTRVDEDGEETETLSIANRLRIEEYEEWYEKCVRMYTDGRVKDFLSHGYILVHNYLMSNYGYQKKQTISKVQMWDMLQKLLKACLQLKEYQKGITLLEQALNYKPYGESRKYRLELDYLLTTTCFVAGDYSKAFDSFRILITHEQDKHIEGNALWNLFTQIVNKMMDKRHHRFSLRLLFKKPNLVPLVIHNGNNSHMSGTYKYAIGEFSRAFREWPTDPLNSLLLGVSFLHLSIQKFHKTRHASSLHGIIFIFQYFYLRGKSQEAHYNLARAFHQIGLVHLAVFYYNKALSFPLHREEKIKDQHRKAEYHPFVDLHREAAYNLARIYQNSGNKALARSILHKYCWV